MEIGIAIESVEEIGRCWLTNIISDMSYSKDEALYSFSRSSWRM